MGQLVGRILFSFLGVAALAAAGLLVPHFLTPANLLNVVRQSSIIGIGAVGMTMVIVILGIDLSIAGLIVFCLMVLVQLILHGISIFFLFMAGTNTTMSYSLFKVSVYI